MLMGGLCVSTWEVCQRQLDIVMQMSARYSVNDWAERRGRSIARSHSDKLQYPFRVGRLPADMLHGHRGRAAAPNKSSVSTAFSDDLR